jgi:hypothetical protein
MSRESQSPWPRPQQTGSQGYRAEPNACFLSPDGKARSDRSLAGPLRLGTEPRVGPRGALRNGSSDMGVDRVSPRGFDPLGTSDSRAPPQEASTLISKEVRRYNKRNY